MAIPRDIINRFLCTSNGEEVFHAELFPAIAAIRSSPSLRSQQRAARSSLASDKSPSNEGLGSGSDRRRCSGACETAWSERAEPYDYGEPEAVALELYLIVRARGMPIETPGVRP